MDLLYLREPVSAFSHGVWFLLSLPGALLLWRRARGNRSRQVVLLGYTICLGLCASASSLYHSIRGPNEDLLNYLLLDHIGIYVLIAGTFTPIAGTLMVGRWKWGTLGTIWLAAAVGISLNLFFGDLPGWLGTTIYLAMGWGSVFCYLELSKTISHRTLRPITVGGILYSVGSVFHVLHWPVIWPGFFGGHELFHLFVVAASATHYQFMLKVVAPWSGTTEAPKLEPEFDYARAAFKSPRQHRRIQELSMLKQGAGSPADQNGPAR